MRMMRLRCLEKMKKWMVYGHTSEVLAEVRSGGTSRDAGVTLASLGLSLVNNFRMGEKESGRRGNEMDRKRGGEWEGKEDKI
jgi:hypothetical protein